MRIFDKNGNLKAEYSYDAWGKCTIKTNVSGIATINPFRYRGYYCDKETGLYYLNARYYDPEIGRFISPDAIDTVVTLSFNVQNGLNSYAYCLNDPVNYCDIQGFFPSKGHQSGHGFDEFRGLSVGQLDELYKLLRKSRNKEDRATAQKIQTELKLRQMRNKTKREGYGRSKMVIISRTLPRIFVYPSYSDILPGILSSPFGLELPSSTWSPLDVSIDGLIIDGFIDFNFNFNFVINSGASPATSIGIGAFILFIILLIIPGPQPI